MDTALEESNLAHIGSEEDKAAKEAAAKLEHNWDGVGQKEGIEVWRVENTRDENDNPDFGIKPWPVKRYGEFYKGDSYIVLQTTKEEEELVWDIYFWIGNESSQDEYGVAAYKSNELDDLLGDAPIQHREVEGHESQEFMDCFPKGVRYLDGGIESGFRNVDPDAPSIEIPSRLFQVHKHARLVRIYQVPLLCSSLNEGDAFVLDAGTTIYTWFGSECSPFEKSKTASVAHNVAQNRFGHCHVEIDVQDDNEEFWNLLGGKGMIKPASDVDDEDVPVHKTKMYTVSDSFGGGLTVTEVPAAKENLNSSDVCLIDDGPHVYVWVGKGASKREQQQSMIGVQRQIEAMGRERTTSVVRVIEGQERRCKGFSKLFN